MPKFHITRKTSKVTEKLATKVMNYKTVKYTCGTISEDNIHMDAVKPCSKSIKHSWLLVAV